MKHRSAIFATVALLAVPAHGQFEIEKVEVDSIDTPSWVSRSLLRRGEQRIEHVGLTALLTRYRVGEFYDTLEFTVESPTKRRTESGFVTGSAREQVVAFGLGHLTVKAEFLDRRVRLTATHQLTPHLYWQRTSDTPDLYTAIQEEIPLVPFPHVGIAVEGDRGMTITPPISLFETIADVVAIWNLPQQTDGGSQIMYLQDSVSDIWMLVDGESGVLRRFQCDVRETGVRIVVHGDAVPGKTYEDVTFDLEGRRRVRHLRDLMPGVGDMPRGAPAPPMPLLKLSGDAAELPSSDRRQAIMLYRADHLEQAVARAAAMQNRISSFSEEGGSPLTMVAVFELTSVAAVEEHGETWDAQSRDLLWTYSAKDSIDRFDPAASLVLLLLDSDGVIRHIEAGNTVPDDAALLRLEANWRSMSDQADD